MAFVGRMSHAIFLTHIFAFQRELQSFDMRGLVVLGVGFGKVRNADFVLNFSEPFGTQMNLSCDCVGEMWIIRIFLAVCELNTGKFLSHWKELGLMRSDTRWMS